MDPGATQSTFVDFEPALHPARPEVLRASVIPSDPLQPQYIVLQLSQDMIDPISRGYSPRVDYVDVIRLMNLLLSVYLQIASLPLYIMTVVPENEQTESVSIYDAPRVIVGVRFLLGFRSDDELEEYLMEVDSKLSGLKREGAADDVDDTAGDAVRVELNVFDEDSEDNNAEDADVGNDAASDAPSAETRPKSKKRKRKDTGEGIKREAKKPKIPRRSVLFDKMPFYSPYRLTWRAAMAAFARLSKQLFTGAVVDGMQESEEQVVSERQRLADMSRNDVDPACIDTYTGWINTFGPAMLLMSQKEAESPASILRYFLYKYKMSVDEHTEDQDYDDEDHVDRHISPNMQSVCEALDNALIRGAPYLRVNRNQSLYAMTKTLFFDQYGLSIPGIYADGRDSGISGLVGALAPQRMVQHSFYVSQFMIVLHITRSEFLPSSGYGHDFQYVPYNVRTVSNSDIDGIFMSTVQRITLTRQEFVIASQKNVHTNSTIDNIFSHYCGRLEREARQATHGLGGIPHRLAQLICDAEQASAHQRQCARCCAAQEIDTVKRDAFVERCKTGTPLEMAIRCIEDFMILFGLGGNTTLAAMIENIMYTLTVLNRPGLRLNVSLVGIHSTGKSFLQECILRCLPSSIVFRGDTMTGVSMALGLPVPGTGGSVHVSAMDGTIVARGDMDPDEDTKRGTAAVQKRILTEGHTSSVRGNYVETPTGKRLISEHTVTVNNMSMLTTSNFGSKNASLASRFYEINVPPGKSISVTDFGAVRASDEQRATEQCMLTRLRGMHLHMAQLILHMRLMCGERVENNADYFIVARSGIDTSNIRTDLRENDRLRSMAMAMTLQTVREHIRSLQFSMNFLTELQEVYAMLCPITVELLAVLMIVTPTRTTLFSTDELAVAGVFKDQVSFDVDASSLTMHGPFMYSPCTEIINNAEYYVTELSFFQMAESVWTRMLGMGLSYTIATVENIIQKFITSGLVHVQRRSKQRVSSKDAASGESSAVAVRASTSILLMRSRCEQMVTRREMDVYSLVVSFVRNLIRGGQNLYQVYMKHPGNTHQGSNGDIYYVLPAGLAYCVMENKFTHDAAGFVADGMYDIPAYAKYVCTITNDETSDAAVVAQLTKSDKAFEAAFHDAANEVHNIIRERGNFPAILQYYVCIARIFISCYPPKMSPAEKDQLLARAWDKLRQVYVALRELADRDLFCDTVSNHPDLSSEDIKHITSERTDVDSGSSFTPRSPIQMRAPSPRTLSVFDRSNSFNAGGRRTQVPRTDMSAFRRSVSPVVDAGEDSAHSRTSATTMQTPLSERWSLASLYSTFVARTSLADIFKRENTSSYLGISPNDWTRTLRLAARNKTSPILLSCDLTAAQSGDVNPPSVTLDMLEKAPGETSFAVRPMPASPQRYFPNLSLQNGGFVRKSESFILVRRSALEDPCYSDVYVQQRRRDYCRLTGLADTRAPEHREQILERRCPDTFKNVYVPKHDNERCVIYVGDTVSNDITAPYMSFSECPSLDIPRVFTTDPRIASVDTKSPIPWSLFVNRHLLVNYFMFDVAHFNAILNVVRDVRVLESLRSEIFMSSIYRVSEKKKWTHTGLIDDEKQRECLASLNTATVELYAYNALRIVVEILTCGGAKKPSYRAFRSKLFTTVPFLALFVDALNKTMVKYDYDLEMLLFTESNRRFDWSTCVYKPYKHLIMGDVGIFSGDLEYMRKFEK